MAATLKTERLTLRWIAGHEEAWSLARNCAVQTRRMVQMREDAILKAAS